MENSLRDVSDALPTLVWTCLAEGPCDYLSRQWVDYTGIPEGEQLGNGWLTQIHPEDRERVKAELATVGRGVAFDIEFRIRRADGVYRWFRTRAIPLRDPEGRIVKWYGSNSDVDDYKRVEEALRESEARLAAAHDRVTTSEAMYRALFENSSDGILIAEMDTRAIRYANHAAARMTGYSENELRTMCMADLVPKDAALCATGTADFVTIAGAISVEGAQRLKKDGTVIFVDVTGARLTIDGRTMIAGFFRDVTERRNAEVAHRRLSMAIEQADEAIFITDAEGVLVYVNPAFEALTGYSQEEVLGRNPRLLKSGAHDDAFYRTLWKTITGGKTWRGRLVDKKKDGTTFTVDGTISPVHDADGFIVNYVAVRRDVTGALALEAQFLQAQKMEAVGRLAGGVAHDFNNVLSVILSYGEMLLLDLKPGEPMRDDVEEIQKAGLRAADLTRQLLMFSRQQVLEPKVLDLNEVLTSMDKMLQRILGADVGLVSLPSQPLGRVRVDPGSIEQVIMNLVVNARDAMPTGGKLTMETDNVVLDEAYASEHLGVKPGPYVMLAVTDTGTGIDKATLARIFEPFFTTKEAGKGTGLGLSTVFGIAQQSGGSVWVYSEPGTGTTFKIYLPRVDAAVDAVRTIAPPANLRGSETILLVEDDDQVRAVARGILRRNGYYVIEARNAGEALLHSERHPGTIHLLLSDVVMPQMSGPELAKRLANARPGMKVLCMSGYTDDSIVRHGVLEAHIAYLQKPITPETLTTKVREVLESPNGGTA